LRTFNCGIGMIAIVAAEGAQEASRALAVCGLSPVRLGEVVPAADQRVRFSGRLNL